LAEVVQGEKVKRLQKRGRKREAHCEGRGGLHLNELVQERGGGDTIDPRGGERERKNGEIILDLREEGGISCPLGGGKRVLTEKPGEGRNTSRCTEKRGKGVLPP